MLKILMFEISAKKGLCDVICVSEVKTSDLATHFSRNCGATNTVLFIFLFLFFLNLASRLAEAMAREKGSY